jgi:hypothetical protein
LGIELLLVGDGAVGVEDGLSDVAEHAGLFGREAVLDQSVEDFGHDLLDVGGRGEVAGGLSEFGGEGIVGVGALVAIVELAEAGGGRGEVAARFAGARPVVTAAG